MKAEGHRRTVSLVLFAVALGLLFAAGLVRFNDTPGTGGEVWRVLIGVLAIVLAVASVVVAWPEPGSRLWTGIAQAVLFAGVLWQNIGSEDFWFVWRSGTGGLLLLEFALGVTAFVLIATGARPAPPPGETARAPAEVKVEARDDRRLRARVARYAWGTVVLTAGAFASGMAVYESTECTDTSCDLAVVSGAVWAVYALIISVVAITVIESVLEVRRRRRTSTELDGE